MTIDATDTPADDFPPPQWADLDARTRVNLCCDVIEGNEDFLSDALSLLDASEIVEHLRESDEQALGAAVVLSVLKHCRAEVERRLETGDFFL